MRDNLSPFATSASCETETGETGETTGEGFCCLALDYSFMGMISIFAVPKKVPG
jgi:hypothetical protein